jgi:hypothetical protein
MESGIKTNPWSFFRFADMKRNQTGFPSTMLISVEGAPNSQDITDLFAGYFQGVYVNDVSVDNADGYDKGSDDPSVLSLIQFTEDDVDVTLMNLEEKTRSRRNFSVDSYEDFSMCQWILLPWSV